MILVEKVKLAVTLIMVAFCAYTDLKERNIYILPVILGVVSSCLLDALGNGIRINSICISMLVLLFIVGLRAYVGTGDAYMVSAMFLMMPALKAFYVIFFAVLICGLFGVFVLILNRRSGFSVPFAPFVLAGFLYAL